MSKKRIQQTVVTEVDLKELSRGDHAAFLTAYTAYHGKLYKFAFNYLHNKDRVEDVIHNVFLKLWETCGRIDPTLPLLNYLYTITRNEVLKELRAQAKYAISIDSLHEDSLPQLSEMNIERMYDDRRYEHYLQRAIDTLSPRKKQVFELCRVQGKSYKEAARILGISTHTVKEYLMEAVSFIRKYMFQHTDLVISALLFLKIFF